MDAYEAIIRKRDRREYDGRPIPEETLHRILQAGRMAGSSSNSQPLRFIVMRDQAAKEKLAPAGPGTAPLVNAPLAIVICIQQDRRDFDVGRSAQNMMVAAWAEGIHSCPIGLRNEEVAREALGLPAEYTAAIGLSFRLPVRCSTVPIRRKTPRHGGAGALRPLVGCQSAVSSQFSVKATMRASPCGGTLIKLTADYQRLRTDDNGRRRLSR